MAMELSDLKAQEIVTFESEWSSWKKCYSYFSTGGSCRAQVRVRAGRLTHVKLRVAERYYYFRCRCD